MILLPVALATSTFDPTAPAAVFNGEEAYTEDGTIRLWAEIARYEDPDGALFPDAQYNDMTAWPDNDFYAPWIAACFGTREPATSNFLLHVGPSVALATGTPILFVPGAGDNASRGFITMATHMDWEGRPVFALTFPHVHGDNFQQAELLADAIAVVRARTGAEQIDLVAHSKGGIATAIYLSNHEAATWADDTYTTDGTTYRGDVRRAVMIATPLAGIDTAYRWPTGNLLALDAEEAFSPTSWATFYPYSSAASWTSTSLADQDFLPDGADLFPGQRQLLARQDYPLPALLPTLGAYAVQPDWYTTYEGGLGYWSVSDGIDAAVEAGGNVLDSLAANGVDPGVELFLLAGENPLMPNASQWLWAEYFGELWAELAITTLDGWSALIAAAVGDSLLSVGVTEEEVQGITNGDLVLGEITGASDGLVFVSSATHAELLTARGAVVAESKVVNLSHLDLLYASPITGELLIEDAGTDPAKAWQIAVGERYVDADTIGWVERVLEDEAVDPGDDTGEPDTGDTGAPDTGGGDTGDESGTVDTGEESGTDEGSDTAGKEEQTLGCGTCSTGGTRSGLGLAGILVGLVALRRR